MKKNLILSLLLSCCLFGDAIAGNAIDDKKLSLKEDSGEKCFNENTHLIGVAVALGGIHTYSVAGGVSSRTPTFCLTYEQPWKKKLGPGFLGVGAYVGYLHSSYRRDDFGSVYYYEHKWNHFLLMGRAVYHWDVLNREKVEAYAGVLIGMRMQLYSYESNIPGDPNFYRLNEGFIHPAFAVFAGARWYCAKSIALFSEVGYGNSNFTIGANYKF